MIGSAFCTDTSRLSSLPRSSVDNLELSSGRDP